MVWSHSTLLSCPPGPGCTACFLLLRWTPPALSRNWLMTRIRPPGAGVCVCLCHPLPLHIKDLLADRHSQPAPAAGNPAEVL